MGFAELLIIAVGLAMDAFAVSVCKGLSVSSVKPKHIALTALWFGGFQALMPLIGYYLGTSFADMVSDVDHWIAFVLLGIIGGNMIRESFHKDEPCESDTDFSPKKMLALAVATSIDALAIGVSFSFLKINIWPAVVTIGVVTALFSGSGVVLGRYLGCKFKNRAEFAGGFILIALGLKIFLEHTL